jgi:hypothetical protein
MINKLKEVVRLSIRIRCGGCLQVRCLVSPSPSVPSLRLI